MLKLFPRTKHGVIDDGTGYDSMTNGQNCIKCGEQLFETVSLEFCGYCGHISTDYWGIEQARLRSLNNE